MTPTPPKAPVLGLAACLVTLGLYLGLTAGLRQWRPGPDRGAVLPRAAADPNDPGLKTPVTGVAPPARK